MIVSALLRIMLKALGLKRILGLVAVIFFFTLVFYFTLGFAEALYGFYGRSYSNVGGGIVVSGFSTTPYTSIVSVSYVRKVLLENMCEAEVYEIASTPVIVGGKVFVLKGFDKVFAEKLGFKTVSGEEFGGECYGCVWVGDEVAKELNIKVGDAVVFYSPFSKKPFLSFVKGIVSGDPVSYEIIAPLKYVKQVRGLGGNLASMVVVYSSRNCSREKLAAIFGISAEKMELLGRALVLLQKVREGVFSAKTYTSFYEAYVGRLGLSRNVFYTAALAVALASTVGVFVAGMFIPLSERSVLKILREQGVSEASVRVCLAIIYTALASLSVIAGYVFVAYLSPLFLKVSIMGYSLTPYLGLADVLAVYLATVSMLTLGSLTVKLQ